MRLGFGVLGLWVLRFWAWDEFVYGVFDCQFVGGVWGRIVTDSEQANNLWNAMVPNLYFLPFFNDN